MRMTYGFDHRWMDTYPRPHKLSGAHMDGYAYDVHPYVLMNYNDDYESVTTVAHEWGHAMHSYLANKAQPFVTSNYAIFIAEIASTFNEELLLQRVLKTAKTDDERLYYLGYALEQLRGTFFRQAMFAEFERNIHARVDKGEPLTGEALTKTYCEILKRYHGASEGVVDIDDAYCVEWAYIPHFYNSFYVYQYATSIAASALFAQRVGANEPGALPRYLDLLKAGGSGYPYELVKKAGVDLATPAPYQALVARMNSIMDEIEAILAKAEEITAQAFTRIGRPGGQCDALIRRRQPSGGYLRACQLVVVGERSALCPHQLLRFQAPMLLDAEPHVGRPQDVDPSHVGRDLGLFVGSRNIGVDPGASLRIRRQRVGDRDRNVVIGHRQHDVAHGGRSAAPILADCCRGGKRPGDHVPLNRKAGKVIDGIGDGSQPKEHVPLVGQHECRAACADRGGIGH